MRYAEWVEPADEKGLERVAAFSDGVFAIAITLLVLELRVPDLPPHAVASELGPALGALWPKFFALALSFLVIGRYWIAHHRLVGYLCRYDRRFLNLNLLFLFCITLIPFPTAVLGAYNDAAAAAQLYAVNLAATGYTSCLLWWYATARRRLVDPSLDEATVRLVGARSLVPAVAFTLSLLLTLFSPTLVELSWVAILFGSPWAARRFAGGGTAAAEADAD